MSPLRRATEPQPATNGHATSRSGLDERRRGWFWHWNSIVTQYAPLIGLKGIGLLNSYTVWTDRRSDSPFHGYAFPSQEAEAAFYGEERQELITINKILVTLGLIEIKKEMVVRVDAQGQRWRVPHNLYRVRDSEDGYTLSTDAVRAVLELARQDAEVFRYIRHIFAPRFAPIDRHNPWHAILAELRPTSLWQELVQRAEATAESYRRRAARTRRTARSDNGVTTVATSDGDAPAQGSPTAVAISDSGSSFSGAAGDNAPAGSVTTSDRTYHQSESRSTFDGDRGNDQEDDPTGHPQIGLPGDQRLELPQPHDAASLPAPAGRNGGALQPFPCSSAAEREPGARPAHGVQEDDDERARSEAPALGPLLAMLRPCPGQDAAELVAALVAELAPAVQRQTPELAPEDWVLAAVIEAVDQAGAGATIGDVAAICRRWARDGFRTAAPEGEPAGAGDSPESPGPARSPAPPDEPLDTSRLWHAVLQEVRRNVSLAVYRTWFHETVLVRQESRRLVVRAPSRLGADWLRTRGVRVLQQAVERVAGQPLEVQIVAP